MDRKPYLVECAGIYAITCKALVENVKTALSGERDSLTGAYDGKEWYSINDLISIDELQQIFDVDIRIMYVIPARKEKESERHFAFIEDIENIDEQY